MSADNGIYIHKFRDGWRVVHTQAIDNIYWHRGDKKYNYRILKEVFNKSPLFKKKGTAVAHAFVLASDTMTEYGVCEV